MPQDPVDNPSPFLWRAEAKTGAACRPPELKCARATVRYGLVPGKAENAPDDTEQFAIYQW
jgi:hypothetical protein